MKYKQQKRRENKIHWTLPPAISFIIYLTKHDVNERVRGKHKQISVRFVMTLKLFYFLFFIALSLSFLLSVIFSFCWRNRTSRNDAKGKEKLFHLYIIIIIMMEKGRKATHINIHLAYEKHCRSYCLYMNLLRWLYNSIISDICINK